MSLFLASVTSKIDAQNRASLPVAFRNILLKINAKFDADSCEPNTMFVFPSLRTASLDCFGMDHLAKLNAQLDGLDWLSEEYENIATGIISNVTMVQWDTKGRLILPENLKIHGNITQDIMFVGRGTTFQIWNPDIFTVHQSSVMGRLKDGYGLKNSKDCTQK